jgi:hypothetical protein
MKIHQENVTNSLSTEYNYHNLLFNNPKDDRIYHRNNIIIPKTFEKKSQHSSRIWSVKEHEMKTSLQETL